MEINYTRTSFLFITFIILLSFLSHSFSIVKNLPGFDGDLPFSFETGYVGVGADNEIKVFYYFVESQRDPLHDPFLIYLTGGPGTSGLYPFLYQIGPLSINFVKSTYENVSLELNPNTWAKKANLLFFDLPVGTGFTYATTYEATISNDTILAQQIYQFLIKWLEEHPKFLNNPLYVTGISYMGLLVPIVTLEVYKGNERGNQPHLNIIGCLIISPFTDRFGDFNSKFEFAHRLALISDDIYKSGINTCHGNYLHSDPENTECLNTLQRVDELTSKINVDMVLDPYCDDNNTSPTCGTNSAKYFDSFGNDKEVQKALNVRVGTIERFEKTNETIHYRYNKKDQDCYKYDITSSVDYHKELVSKKCQVMILSGDHDFTFPYIGAEQWIKSLNLPIASPWEAWFVNNQVAGYRMKYAKDEYSLTYATVKGAGHSIPVYKPEESWAILDEWLASYSYLSDS